MPVATVLWPFRAKLCCRCHLLSRQRLRNHGTRITTWASGRFPAAAKVHDNEEKAFDPIEQRAGVLAQTAKQLRASAVAAKASIKWGDDTLESLALREKQV